MVTHFDMTVALSNIKQFCLFSESLTLLDDVEVRRCQPIAHLLNKTWQKVIHAFIDEN